MRKEKVITDIIAAVYSNRYRLAPRRIETSGERSYSPVMSRVMAVREALGNFFKSHILLTWIAVALLLKTLLFTHYYNKLVDAEFNMLASYSDMLAQVQRRNDIASSLAKVVFDYSKYEENVFTAIVALRTLNKDGAASDAQPLAKVPMNGNPPEGHETGPADTGVTAAAGVAMLPGLSKFVAVAEQYPDLKLNDNLTTLMNAMVEIEKDLAAQRIKFNANANSYTSIIRRFPDIVFAKIFGFKNFPYFEATEEAKNFKRIENLGIN